MSNIKQEKRHTKNKKDDLNERSSMCKGFQPEGNDAKERRFGGILS